MTTARAVGSLRQECTGCGRSCHGVRVRLVSEEEEERVAGFGAILGIERPIEDGRLRFVDGRCVFQDGAVCGIHARWGSAAKPALCRQYPLVVLETEEGLRVGVDPGCYTVWATHREAPALPLTDTLANKVPLDPANLRQEAFLLPMLQAPGMTVGRALTTMLGTPDLTGFSGRWIARLRQAPLRALLARPETGVYVRDTLSPVLDALDRLDPAAPPAFPLAPEQDAWAVEVAARLVGLRLVSSAPMVQLVPLLALGGALVCGWADPRPEAFGPALAAWTRAMRAPIWCGAILPSPDALRELVSGG